MVSGSDPDKISEEVPELFLAVVLMKLAWRSDMAWS